MGCTYSTHLGIHTTLYGIDEIGTQCLHLIESNARHHILAEHNGCDERLGVLHSWHAKQSARWGIAKALQCRMLRLEQYGQNGRCAGTQGVAHQHQVEGVRHSLRIPLQRTLNEILLLQLVAYVNRRLHHALVPEPIVPGRLQWQHLAFCIQIRQYILHAQRAAYADHDLLLRIIDGHKERRLTHIHVVGGVHDVDVAQLQCLLQCGVVAVAAIVLDHLAIVPAAKAAAKASAKENSVISHEYIQVYNNILYVLGVL